VCHSQYAVQPHPAAATEPLFCRSFTLVWNPGPHLHPPALREDASCGVIAISSALARSLLPLR